MLLLLLLGRRLDGGMNTLSLTQPKSWPFDLSIRTNESVQMREGT